MTTNFKTFTFGEGDNEFGDSKKRYKGEAGRTDRISFCWFPLKEKDGVYTLNIKGDLIENDLGEEEEEGKKPTFVACKRVYIEGVGYVVADHPDIVKMSGKDAKTAIATVVIKWPTDKRGELSKERLREGEFEALPWVFSEDKYNQLVPLQSEYPFNSHDVSITCTDSQFQKMAFSPRKNNLLRTYIDQAEKGQEKAIQHLNDILANVNRALSNVNAALARELTVDQVRAKLNGGDALNAASPIGDVSASSAIDDLVDSILA